MDTSQDMVAASSVEPRVGAALLRPLANPSAAGVVRAAAAILATVAIGWAVQYGWRTLSGHDPIDLEATARQYR